jgi:hypothetical protein
MNAPLSIPSEDGFQSDRLWSLWDIMQRFRVPSFTAALTTLHRAIAAIHMANVMSAAPDDEADRRIIRDALNEALPSLNELPVSRVIRSQFERLQAAVAHASGVELSVLVREFSNNLMVEFSSAWFLMIPADQRESYEQRKPPFGETVVQAFADASQDIAAASRCYALDEWTACVFHLMRVLEHGLRALATKVGLPPNTMAHENWKNVIDQIESKIREMEKDPKTPDKIARITTLSSAATQFRYFKDAWRNHVSHSRASYDQHEGDRVWTHVKAFMQHMAANP